MKYNKQQLAAIERQSKFFLEMMEQIEEIKGIKNEIESELSSLLKKRIQGERRKRVGAKFPNMDFDFNLN